MIITNISISSLVPQDTAALKLFYCINMQISTPGFIYIVFIMYFIVFLLIFF